MAQSTKARPAGQPQPAPRARKGTYTTISSIGVLARWQLRQTWRLLIIMGVGLLAAVALVGMIPLYAQVSGSAGLQHALETDPQSDYIQVHAQNLLFGTEALNAVQDQLTQIIQSELGSAISTPPDLSVQVSTLNFTPNASPTVVPRGVNTFVRLLGADVSQATKRVQLLHGRLPTPTSNGVIEFAVPTLTQSDLHLQLGQTFTLPFNIVDQTNQVTPHNLTFRLVGVFAPFSSNNPDLFWHGETFVPEVFTRGLAMFQRYPLLVSNNELMDEFNALSMAAIQGPSGANDPQFTSNPDTTWYYRFDFAHLDINHLSDLITSVNSILGIINHNPEEPPYVSETTSTGPLSALNDYSHRATVVALPILGLTILIGGLVLFFVVLMTDLLVERQVTAITLLRGRGASARQIFGSLLWQGLGMGLIAFVAGPLLAILLVELLTRMTLQPSDLVALNLITANPIEVARGLTQNDLIVVGLAVLAMVLATWRVMRSNILLQRRETARSTQKPFWIRFRLDLVAAVLALAGFGFTLYVASPGVLDSRTRVLILPLTSLAGVFCLLVGALLLFLRFFPAVLHMGERLAARNRGVAPVLALAQMARSPRQSLRMTLLFALAVAFSLFTLIFTETQLQRLPDVTSFQVGSDISGQISLNLAGDSVDQQRDFFNQIKGVTSATLVTNAQLSGGSENNILIDMQAVDTSTYARTIYWTAQDGSQSISTLTNQLIKQRSIDEKQNIIPAIIDDTAAQSLGVSVGHQFVLKDLHGPLTYMVVAVVHYIPMIYDTTSNTGEDFSIPHGGILVDFDTLSTVALAVSEEGIFPDTVLVRTTDNPTDIANVRQVLFNGLYQLAVPQDRRAILASLSTDPLAQAVIGILDIGAAVALLLALLGTLLVSWLNARSRKTSFAIMRALGCMPRQIVSILLWEQGIVYGVALALGVGLSVLFSLLILPVFVFTPLAGGNVALSTTDAFYVVQSVPTIQVIVPIVPVVALLAGLILICVLALGMMVRVVTQPHMSQELRVDED
ncbi:MAG: FtsX-like permease family protein [Ktedonobacteraceae bacterium]